MTHSAARSGFTQRFHWSGYLLGFSLGGFFDGILLHQILQWHHLLSAVQGPAFTDIRVQILADGLFHALMYVIAAIGLWLLWRVRDQFAARAADRLLFANLLIGFGSWHIIDAVLSHWLIGIHRIRMDSPNPLLWDLAWFVVFGLLPLVIGYLLRRRTRTDSPAQPNVSAVVWAILVVGAGAAASVPPRNVSQVMVYFGPGATAESVFAAAEAVEANVAWSDNSGQLWALQISDRSRPMALYRYGALFVGSSPFPVGCVSWSRAI